MKNTTFLSVSSEYLIPGEETYIHVFGHLNPDSDAICSAIVVADWLNYTGRVACPFRLGELTPETRYILNTAGVSPPELLTGSLADKKVWLVDFTDVEQGPSGLDKCDVIGVIDHHRIGTLITRNPPDVWVRAVGCCGTVILSILMYEIPMPLSVAQSLLLLGAILSDTLALTSSTTTEQDKKAVAILMDIAGVDYDRFVDGLLAAKTDLSGQSAEQLFHRDAKNYRIGEHSVLLSQIEVRDMADITPHLSGLMHEAGRVRIQTRYHMVILIVTDITHRNSTLYISVSNMSSPLPVLLAGMTSRKKDILPWLTDHLSSLER